jgi:hypothetical protein
VYGLLVIERGWSGDRYEAWLTTILRDQLLATQPASDRDR